MAKLSAFLLFVALVATLLVADATRTTITVNEETENPRRGGGEGSMQQCEDQFEQQENLFHCMQYIMQEGMRGGGRRGGGRGSCQFGRCDHNPQFGEQHFEMCCNQLEDMDTMCRCEGLRMMMQRQMGRQMGQMDMEEMREMAGNLPSMCNLSPGRCQFGFGRRYDV